MLYPALNELFMFALEYCNFYEYARYNLTHRYDP